MAAVRLKYGNTNTFYIPGERGGLLVDTDSAGTLPRFFRALGEAGIGLGDIAFLLVTHYHPDHAGLAGELQRRGLILLPTCRRRPSVSRTGFSGKKGGGTMSPWTRGR